MTLNRLSALARATLLALALLGPSAALAAGFQPLDKTTARRLVDPQAHRVPTVVVLWSSDCVHCKKNLRLFGALAKADKQLVLISVATEPESPLLTTLLDRESWAGQRYAYGDEAPEALAYALDAGWHGELPRTLLFDGKGGRRALSGVLDEKTVRQALYGPRP